MPALLNACALSPLPELPEADVPDAPAATEMQFAVAEWQRSPARESQELRFRATKAEPRSKFRIQAKRCKCDSLLLLPSLPSSLRSDVECGRRSSDRSCHWMKQGVVRLSRRRSPHRFPWAILKPATICRASEAWKN